MDDYDEYYHEPTKFEEAALTMRNTMYELVRDELKDEISTLSSRNAELEKRFAKIDALERQAQRKITEAEYAISSAERRAMNARFEEIAKIFGNEYYAIAYKNSKRPKCNKCDDQRKVKAITTGGQELVGSCECDKYTMTYSTHEVLMLKISEKNNWRYIQWHKDSYGDVEFGDRCVKEYSGQPFEEISRQGYVFSDKDTADKFVDFLNKKQ